MRFAPLAALAPLLLAAAAAPAASPSPSPSPGPQAPSLPAAVAADPSLGAPVLADIADWLAVLPAPAGAAPRLLRPVTGGIVSQPFGCTDVSAERKTAACPGGFHTGLDFAEPQGTPIRAAADGLAYDFPDHDGDRYGNHVIVTHAGGLATVYGHMLRMNAGWSRPVRAGDVIGWVGSTGNSTGPHLHFEVRFAGQPLDPAPFLAGAEPAPGSPPAGWPGAPPADWRGLR